MRLLKEWWGWFKRQSWLNKVIIVGLSSSLVLFLIPMVMSWLRPTPVHVGVAFYVYERAFQLEGDTKTYFYEKRNLVSECSLRRVEQTMPKGRAKTPAPQSWVLTKFLLENVSGQNITNFRMGVRSPLLHPNTTLVTTRDIKASGALDTTAQDAPPTYVIVIPVIADMASSVLILKTPIDEKVRRFLYIDRARVTIQVPFLSADQFGTFPLKISRLNAMKILNRETVLRTDDETFADEKMEYELLQSDEPDLHDEDTSYLPLPKARTCPEGTAGDW